MRVGIALASLIAILIGGLVAFTIATDRALVLANAEDRLAGTSHLVLVHAESAIEDADKVLLALGDLAGAWDYGETGRAALLDRARKLSAGSPQIISFWITDPAGENRLTTLAPSPGWRIPNNRDRAYFRAHGAGESGAALTSESGPGPVSGRRRFVLSRSLRAPDGTLRMVLAVGIATDYFAGLYERISGAERVRIGLQLLSGEVLIPPQHDPFETEIVSAVQSAARSHPSGVRTLTGKSGGQLTSWYGSSHFPELVAVASQPIDDVLAPWRQRAMLFAALAVICFVILGAAVATALRMLRLQQEARLNETLFREVHHRVKNSLQMVTSLLRLNANRSMHPEARAQISSIGSRIQAISSVHDLLHSSAQLDLTDMADLGRMLCRHLAGDTDRRIEFSGETAKIDSRIATTLGIVLNELATNALKHCASTVRVSCRAQDGTLEIVVEDDGPGLPEGFDVEASTRFGLRMAHQLVAQLDGRLEHVRGEPGSTGTRLRVTVPLSTRAGRGAHPELGRAALVGGPAQDDRRGGHALR